MAAFAPALGQSLRSRPPRNPSGQQNSSPKQLEFGTAMKDFKCMFPDMDDEVIEAVLRANNGLVDATIDQLLTMGAGTGESTTNSSDLPFLPSYNDSEPREPPPAYTPREASLIDLEDSLPRPLPSRPYTAWNPPLLGKLPDDFLRIGPPPPSQTTANSSPSQQINTERTAEHELEQFLEDEKLAMCLQNEEFMRELRHNRDFMTSLEKDRQSNQPLSSNASSSSQIPSTMPSLPAPPLPASFPTPVVTSHSAASVSSHRADEGRSDATPSVGATGGPPSSSTHHEDAMMREKLRHMGKSTRKKFDRMARMFQRKKNTQKATLITGGAASTANLLEDYEEEEDDDMLNVMGAGRLVIMEEKDEESNGDDAKSQHQKVDQLGGEPKHKVTTYEPIVFFAEDNEFEYKSEK